MNKLKYYWQFILYKLKINAWRPYKPTYNKIPGNNQHTYRRVGDSIEITIRNSNE